MSASHLSGAISGGRQGGINVAHSFVMDFSAYQAIGANNQFLVKIPGTTANPIAFRISAIVHQQFVNGANAVTLSAGYGVGGTQLLNAVDMKAVANSNYQATGAIRMRDVETDIYITLTNAVTAATAGRVLIVLEVWDVNLKVPTLPE